MPAGPDADGVDEIVDLVDTDRQVAAEKVAIEVSEGVFEVPFSARESSESLVQAQQRLLVARTKAKVLEAETAVDDLGVLVKQQRYARLDRYAVKYGWTPEAPPTLAFARPEIGVWWAEWRDLRAQQAGSMAAEAAP